MAQQKCFQAVLFFLQEATHHTEGSSRWRLGLCGGSGAPASSHQTSCSLLSPEVRPLLQLRLAWLTFAKYMLPAGSCVRVQGGLLRATVKHSPNGLSSLTRFPLRRRRVLQSAHLAACPHPVAAHWARIQNLRDLCPRRASGVPGPALVRFRAGMLRLVRFQGMFNKRARWGAGCHPVGVPLVL